MKDFFSAGGLLGVLDRVFYSIVVNLGVILSNILLIFFILMTDAKELRDYLPLILVLLLFNGPAMSALFYCMNQFLNKTEGVASKEFLKRLKRDYFKKLKLGILPLFLALVFYTNIEFFCYQIPFMPCYFLFITLLLVDIVYYINLYLIEFRYEMTTKQIMESAFLLILRKPMNLLGTLIVLFFVLVLFELFRGLIILFMPAIFGLLILSINRRLLKEFEGN